MLNDVHEGSSGAQRRKLRAIARAAIDSSDSIIESEASFGHGASKDRSEYVITTPETDFEFLRGPGRQLFARFIVSKKFNIRITVTLRASRGNFVATGE